MMSNLLGATSKSYLTVWIYALIGLVLVIVKPSFGLGWAFLNIFLFQLIVVLLIVPHELGHAIAARLMGMEVTKIIIGVGRTLFTIQLLGILWEVKISPVNGRTLFLGKSTYFYRLRVFLIVLAGPLTNVLLILLSLQIPRDIFLSNPPGIYLFPGIIFYLANTLILAVNLFPHYLKSDDRLLQSDGLQMLTIPFISKQEITQKVALSYVIEGQNHQSQGHYKQAIESFNEAIRKNPACVIAYYGRGLAYYNWRVLEPTTKLQNAIKDFSQAIQIDPNYPNIEVFYFIRAACYSYLGDEMRAIEDFTKIIQLNSNSNSYYNRGAVYYQSHNYEAAIEDFSQAINLDSKNAAAYYSRGNAKYELQDKLGAFQDYKTAESLEVSSEAIISEDEHGFYARAIAHFRLENWVRAMQDFQRAEILCSKHGNTKLSLQIRDAIRRIPDIPKHQN